MHFYQNISRIKSLFKSEILKIDFHAKFIPPPKGEGTNALNSTSNLRKYLTNLMITYKKFFIIQNVVLP